jgi:hypothetical protein
MGHCPSIACFKFPLTGQLNYRYNDVLPAFCNHTWNSWKATLPRLSRRSIRHMLCCNLAGLACCFAASFDMVACLEIRLDASKCMRRDDIHTCRPSIRLLKATFSATFVYYNHTPHQQQPFSARYICKYKTNQPNPRQQKRWTTTPAEPTTANGKATPPKSATVT